MIEQTMFDVVYTRNGNTEFYARGLTLDMAREVATNLGSTIVIARTGSDGYQGGTTLTQAISNVRVVRSPRTGTNIDTQTTVTETLTVVTSGQELFTLANTPFVSGGNMTVTVNASADRPDVIWELINETFGTSMVRIAVPFLNTTDTVTTTYNYITGTVNPITVTGEIPNESPDGSRKVFTLDHVYLTGTLTVTSSVDAVSGACTVIEGGGAYLEIYHLQNDTAVALPTGTLVTVSYKYSKDDDDAIPAIETRRGPYPSWVGTAHGVPFDSMQT